MRWSEADTARSLANAFDACSRDGSERTAIVSGGGALSYAELAALADRYGAALLDRVPEPERVAILLRHDAPMIAAALGALGCGAAVIALSPTDPPARLAQIRAATEPDLLLTDEQHLALAAAAGFEPVRTVDVSAAGDGAAPSDPRRALEADDPAFLISTSGTTGTPKVVVHTHRNVLHNVLRYSNGLGIGPDDRVLSPAALSGGQGIATTWAALLSGATICPFPIAERGVTGLADWIENHEITVLDTIPSVLRSFAQTLRGRRVEGVRLVRLASEGALTTDFELFQRHFPAAAVLASVFACSEAGIVAQELLESDRQLAPGLLPVGRPVEGIEVALIGGDGGPVAEGEEGEVVVESAYLSPGYWRDPELTAARFEQLDGTRRFHTGDLARRAADGSLTIAGRADKQVKIRGNRVQLEEVELALSELPDVAAVAVTVGRDARGRAKLNAYVATVAGASTTAAKLRRQLKGVLPAHAIPSSFSFLEQLPLNAHGKVDRTALPAPAPARSSRAAATKPPTPRARRAAAPAPGKRPPRGRTVERLLPIWSEAFGSEVSAHDPFLELGGDSLIAAVIVAGVHEVFGVDLELRVFAADITAAGLAALIEQRQGRGRRQELPPLRRTPRTGPLSTSQARVWRAAAFERTDPYWHVAVPFRITGPLDVEALRKGVEYVVRRHEILRTTFAEFDGRPLSVVRAPERFKLEVQDLRAAPDAQAIADQLLEEELERPFDLEQGPLLRMRLLRTGEQEYQLLRTTHHLIHDALSWRIFFRELASIYEALRDGRPMPLPETAPLQYIDYAVWERSLLRPESRRYRAELDWWARRLEQPVPPLMLPFERSEPDPNADPADGFMSWGIDPRHSKALDEIGRSAGATYFMTRLAALSALLALDAGTEDFVIGTPLSTRTRAELHDVIGMFLNFAVLRLRFTGGPSFTDWLAEVRRAVIDTGGRVMIPTERLRRELIERGVRPPSAAVRFVAWATLGPMRFGGIELEPLPRRCRGASGFRLGVNRPYEADRCWVEFDPKVHDPKEVERFLGRLRALAAAVSAEPDRPLRDLHVAAVHV